MSTTELSWFTSHATGHRLPLSPTAWADFVSSTARG